MPNLLDSSPSLGGTVGVFPLNGKALTTAVVVGLVGLCVLLFGISEPRVHVFDESYYVPAAKAIASGSLNMDPGEPPLGKLLIAIGIKAAGDTPLGWRLPGAVCGALSLAAVFLWTRLLLGDSGVSLLAAGLTLTNNFLFVLSRVAMMDVFLVFFVMWAVLSYTAAFQFHQSPVLRRILFCASGLLFGLAGACKWNGIDSLPVLLGVSLLLPLAVRLLSAPPSSSVALFAENLRETGTLSLILAFVLLPALSYSFVFWILSRAVHQPFGISEFLHSNYQMWRYHVTDPGVKIIFRHWYQWPFIASPVRPLSYLLGNPVVAWGGFAAIVFCSYRFVKSLAVPEGMVVLLYLANWLQWAFTPSRASYYYYYFPSLMFLGVALAIALHRLQARVFGVRLSLIVMVAATLVFVWCYPRMAYLSSPWDCALGCWT